MVRKIIRVWALALLLFFSSRLYPQSLGLNDGYTRMFGISARSTAMGGAMVGIADGIDAIAYNPAAIALSPDSVSLQFQAFPSSELMVNETNEGPQSFGLIMGLTQKVLRDRIGVGALVGYPASVGGDWPSYATGTLPLLMGYGVAIRLHDTLGIGIAPASNLWIRSSEIQLSLSQLISGLLGIQVGAPATDVNPNVALGISTEDTKYAIAVAFRPVKYLSLGYMDIPLTKTRLRIPIVIKGGGMVDDMRSIMLSDIATTPPIQQYGVGVHIPIPNSKLTLAWTQQKLGFGDLYDELYGDYLEWSDPKLTNAISVGYGPPAPMKNATVNRYGLEYLLNLQGIGGIPASLKQRNSTLAVRGGYFQWKSPYPEELWGTRFDSDADIYSFGLGLSFDRKGKTSLERPLLNNRFSVDMDIQYLDLEEKDYKLQYDYWGNPRSPGDVYWYHTEGQIWAVGFQFSWLH